MPREGTLEELPTRITRDFAAKSKITRAAVSALVEALDGACSTGFSRNAAIPAEAGTTNALACLQQWRDLFRKTCGKDWPAPKTRLDRLAALYGVDYDSAQPDLVLFALQSWYVLLVKLFAAHVLARARGVVSVAELAVDGNCRSAIDDLEQGRVFCRLAVTDPWPGEPFGWLASAWSEPLEKAVAEAAKILAVYDPAAVLAYAAGGGDLLKPLYESLFPQRVRHALGEYYTPRWLAEHVLDRVGYCGQADARLLDPTCGSGTFLLAALSRWRQNVLISLRRDAEDVGWDKLAQRAPAHHLPPARIGGGGGPALASSLVPPHVVGFDIHPLAVASARANYLLAVADLLPPDGFFDVPVFARDCILDSPSEMSTFDFVVGNPPWIAWDNLPGDYREATKPLWQRYGLFSLSGNEARHGGGKKDLSMLVLYAAADRYLRDGGRLGMVITQTLFQSKGAGDGFRRFQIGADGPALGVLRVDDLAAVRPFEDAANWTSVVALEKGKATAYPVPYVKWEVSAAGEPLPAAEKIELLARPIDAARPSSPWIVTHPSRSAETPACAPGPADYTARLGANSGGANAVYWLEIEGRAGECVRVRNLAAKSKRAVPAVEAVLEPDLLYPLVRWGDVDCWSARPSAYILVAQDPATRTGIDEPRMRCDYPRSLAYLQQFEPALTARAAYRRYQGRQPFYSMYNVGPYTIAPFKVIWRRMDRKIRAAVVETIDDPYLGPRAIVPQETCVLIACASSDEAHYLSALLNSAPVHELVSSHSVAGGKGFGTPSILDYVPLKMFNAADPHHAALAAYSRQMHAAALRDAVDTSPRADINRLAATALQERHAP